MKLSFLFKCNIFALLLMCVGIVHAQNTAVLIYDGTQPAIKFAADDLTLALQQKSFSVTTATPAEVAKHIGPNQIFVTTKAATIAGKPTDVAELGKEGFAIRRVQSGNDMRTWIVGQDTTGAMYGGLQIADSIKFDGGLQNVTNSTHSASLAVRGIKFNIPLDARSTSYDDGSTAAQFGIKDVWEMKFWTRFIDQMARSRMNHVSLWSENPFPAMVEYPSSSAFAGAHLDDVKRLAGITNPANTDWFRAESDFQTTKALESVFPIPMTIDKRVKHWQDVMAYAKSRGVAISIVTWNIHIDGTRGAITNHNLVRDFTDAKTKAYFRESVKRLIQTYPDLAAIGVTAGEHMNEEGTIKLTETQKEQWLWDTYGLGYLDALPAGSTRKLGFIHRAHEATMSEITSKFQNLPGYNDADSTLSFTFKYSQAHMHASSNPLFLGNRWVSTIPAGKKLTLEVRNDDFFNMRWGDIDFARAYLNNFRDQTTDQAAWKVDPDKKINGYFMGPDGFFWGREVISKNPSADRQLYIDKMWYSFKIWGHLSFDPSINDARFVSALNAQYPQLGGQANSQKLFTALSKASKVYPWITRFYWGSLDYMWYPESSQSKDGEGSLAQKDVGYVSVQAFADARYAPMSTTQDGSTQTILSVPEFVALGTGAIPAGKLSPLNVADTLDANANDALAALVGLTGGTNNDLKETLGDAKGMAHLGKYYAAKIRGAVELKRFLNNTTGANAATFRANAVSHLTAASAQWKLYADTWAAQYNPQRASRIDKIVNISALQAAVDLDVSQIPTITTTTPPVTATSPQSITSMELVDASNGSIVIQTLSSGATVNTISLSGVIKGKTFSIRAKPDTGPSNVFFQIAGTTTTSRTEGGAPWALLGNTGLAYTPWTATKDVLYTVTATGNSSTGVAGTPLKVQIKFVD